MSETPVEYKVAQSPHARVPARWLPLLYRFAQLKGGRVYNVCVIVPEQQGKPIEWAFMGDGKKENER